MIEQKTHEKDLNAEKDSTEDNDLTALKKLQESIVIHQKKVDDFRQNIKVLDLNIMNIKTVGI